MKKIFIPTALFFLFLSGCASSDSQTELTFSFSASKGGATQIKTVSCPEDISCDMFLAVPKSTWQPVKPNTPCTRIWGGPETMRVEGTIKGEVIDSFFLFPAAARLIAGKEPILCFAPFSAMT